jgi:rhamnulokinase
MTTYVAAVDIGASSGRIMVAAYDEMRRTVQMHEACRFENRIHQRQGRDCWDLDGLYRNILAGLGKIEQDGIDLDAVGVDTWGVDFVLLGRDGQPVGEPVSYRDHRTDGAMEAVHATIPPDEIYFRTGIQFLQFNTLYQLYALLRERPDWLAQVEHLLMIPDYLHYRLCGTAACEYTNATTTQLVNVYTGDWDRSLLARLGVPPHWLSRPVQPGTVLGHWMTPKGRAVKVIAPATHDTASAVAATPLFDERTAYISSGTWSLMGLESQYPMNSRAARACNLTNEGGVDSTFRVLKNIMGLWLIQRVRDELGRYSFADLAAAAETAEPFRYLVNPNDDRFLNPVSMIDAIRAYCRETGQGEPQQPAELARCVFESLAFLYRRTVADLEQVANRKIERIHIVGGGCNNRLLNQLTADFCQLPVDTGPSEASALGNICYQLIGLERLADLDEVRQMIGRTFCGERFLPRQAFSVPGEAAWRTFCRLDPIRHASQHTHERETA